ncbi:MAG TPA: acetylornithine/succinylornithine family transaminase [Treponemataceae bacterium]|jgi:acetylornithine/N-succinyldiaminopimelate aminotransferase|nr:acetylornithine/succinylornithine family transaminase [Treponemataceae bacterium]
MSGKIMNNLGSLPVVFARGDGAVLTDTEGKTYIDFVSGIGVNCLGHNHPALVKALTDQIHKQIHISNYYNSDTGLAFADALLAATGMDRVFFGNSGAEANEAAIKLARKAGWLASEQSGGPERKNIVTVKKSFHGRTIATLAATAQDKFHPDSFAPYPDGFTAIDANDFAALETCFDETVCAFMFECVQGEGGVNLLDPAWIQAACAAAKKAGALVIADEVQTGMGRTGTLLACDALGIAPDVVTLAKGIAGGVPFGACLAKGRAAEVFVPGDHQSTFGGNPLACAAGLVVLAELSKKGFLAQVTENGAYIRDKIAGWKIPGLTGIRGKGLMIGFDITGTASGPASAGDVQKACLETGGAGFDGLCVSTAGPRTVRFLPPLIIGRKEIDAGLEILYTVLTR